MDKLNQRIAILEFCGWNRAAKYDYATDCETVEVWSRKRNNSEELCRFENLPDYLNDLNAANEAEAHLKPLDWARYFDWIQDHGAATGVRATAAERVEGILRAIGKWEE
jgi:hypothetical protein